MAIKKRFRDAGTGQMVTEDYAEANPKTTVSITVENKLEAIQSDHEAAANMLRNLRRVIATVGMRVPAEKPSFDGILANIDNVIALLE